MLHKNIPNNNKDIIRFLAKNFAGTKKVRNTIFQCISKTLISAAR